MARELPLDRMLSGPGQRNKPAPLHYRRACTIATDRLNESGVYSRVGAYGADDAILPAVLPDLNVNLGLVFRDAPS